MAAQDRQAEAEALDDEISSLKTEGAHFFSRFGALLTLQLVASLRKALQVGASTILSSATTQQLLQDNKHPSIRQTRSATAAGLAKRAAQQQAYIHQCLHRISNPVTAFKVRDPDPKAVDKGNVLGLRFEVMSRGQFLRPYYVMLNRPFSNSKHLRVHRHTIPPAIPLGGLAARYLPAPPRRRDRKTEQDLEHFVRALRREIVRYHNRLGVSADLRRGLGLHKQSLEEVSADNIVEMGIADIEAKQIKLTWADERNGRLVMDDDGRVIKVAIFDKEGRDWETAKGLLTNGEHIEDVARRLEESIPT